MKYIYNYFITNYIINIKKNKIEINIFGYGQIDYNTEAKHDALIKIIFLKINNKWIIKTKKSDIYKKMLKQTNSKKNNLILDIISDIYKYVKNI